MMEISKRTYWAIILAGLAIAREDFVVVNGSFNYQDALTKSLIFLEAQRSGKLPLTHRPSWRGDSALEDGKIANMDLVGGYYDAGDNVKFGLPMAFTVTTLACGTIFYRSELKATGELQNAQDAIRWGTDYFLKASARRDHLFVRVGDPVKDHECWMRLGPAIFTSSSQPCKTGIISSHINRLFEFAKLHKGTYDGECPFYCSYSGYQDELLWAATWLYMATRLLKYLEYIEKEAVSASVAEFSWDLKYAGAQVLLSKGLPTPLHIFFTITYFRFYFEGKKSLELYKHHADNFICSVLPRSPYHQVHVSSGGMINLRDGANTQYVTGAALVFSLYSDILAKHNQVVTCGNTQFNSAHLMDFAKQQMDYILGNNPKGRSYMVGFGLNPPQQAHHRGASVPLLSDSEAAKINCAMSFSNWYSKNVPNPNELTGAIVGGPDRNDDFLDLRSNSSMTEPTTYTNSLAVGVLAKLAAYYK